MLGPAVAEPATPSNLVLSTCVVYLGRQLVVTHDGTQHRLTTREAELLRYLASRPSQPVSRDELLREVWGYAETVRSRASDSAMTRLRDKVEQDPKNPVHLLTEFGTGYRFEPAVAAVVEPSPAPRPMLRLTSCAIDMGRRTVVREGQTQSLTSHEAGVLQVLVRRTGEIVARDDLLWEIWGLRSTARGRLLDAVIHRLRAKIEADPANPDHVRTVRGTGFRFDLLVGELPQGEVTLVHAQVHDRRRLLAADEAAWSWVSEHGGARLEALAAKRGAAVLRRDGLHWRWAFDDGTDALRFCCEAQLGWLAVPWASVRDEWAPQTVDDVVVAGGPALDMALLTGFPTPTVDPLTGRPSYQGPEVGRVACLLDACAPGQMLMPRSNGAGLPDLRVEEVELADLPGPDRMACSVLPAALAGRRRLWTDSPATWAALPEVIGELVGREAEVERLLQGLATDRLVTILGPGGFGKTRLGLEVARGHGRTAWADLRGARDENTVLAALVTGLGLRHERSGPPLAVLRDVARELPSDALIVFDEAEGAIDVVREVVEALLREAPGIRLLVTSRHPLRHPAERLYELGPLEREDAVALLNAHLDSPVEPDAAFAIVDAVEGIPLAVELAAARVRRLGAASVAQRLAGGLAVLRSARSVGARPTLQATIAWSVSLLDEPTRHAFAALGVLPAGASVELVEAVIGREDVLECLESLADHSLVRWTGGEVDQFAVIRDHAATALAATPDRADIEARFVSFCTRYGSPDFDASLSGGAAGARRAELVGHRPHLAHALALARPGPDGAAFGQLALALMQAFTASGRHDDAAAVAEEIATRPDTPEWIRASITLIRIARLNNLRRVAETLELSQQVVTTLEALDHPRLLDALDVQSLVTREANETAQCLVVTKKMQAVAEARGAVAQAAMARGRIAELEGDLAGAEAGFRAATQLANEAQSGRAWASLGRILEQRGDYPGALDAQLRAIEGLLAVGKESAAGPTRFLAASAADNLGDLDTARVLLDANARWGRQVGDPFTLGMSLAFLGVVAGRRGDLAEAHGRFEAALTHLEPIGPPEARAFVFVERAMLHLDASHLEDAAADVARAAEHRSVLRPDMAFTLLAVEGELAARLGDGALAEACLATPLDPRLRQETRARFAAATAIARARLGEDPALAMETLRNLAVGRPPTSAIGAHFERATSALRTR